MDEKYMETLAKLAAKEVVEQFEGKMNAAIASGVGTAVALHASGCPAKTTIANVKWLLIGAFGSGVAGGGTFGAWLASALIKASPSTTWMQDVIEKVFG